MVYIFHNYRVDSNNFTIKNNGRTIGVEPRVFDLIVYLIENKSKVVTREELFEVVWKGRDVLDATLSNHIKTARSVLGDDGQSQHTIKTIHGRGYQFVAEIEPLPANSNLNDKLDTGILRRSYSYIALLITFAILTMIVYKSQPTQESIDRAIQDKSIAVLAFLDMSPQKNHEYFSDGISEEILNKLSPLSDLRVISRTSSFYYKDKDTTVKEIGKQLNVSHVLEGSVRKQGDDIRITVQLIETKTSNHLWSQTYDRKIKDVFQVQDEIANAVSDKLKLSLLSKFKTVITVNPDAYNLYLKAKHFAQNRSQKNLKKAELTIRKAIAFDPKFAESWHFLGHIVFESTFGFGMRSYSDGIKTSSYAINKSLKLNANFAPSYATLALIQSQQRNFKDSEQNLKKALALDSKSSFILDIAAATSMNRGNLKKSLNYQYQIRDINPKYLKNLYSIARLNFILRNYGVASENFEKFIALKPNNAVSHHLQCSVLLAQGKNIEALEHAQQEKDGFWKHYAMSMALFANGDIQKANTLLDDFIEKYNKSDLTNIARIYAFRGDIEKSFEWLNKAFNHPDSTLLSWINFPEFEKMHNDPRWHTLLVKMQLPSDHWLMK